MFTTRPLLGTFASFGTFLLSGRASKAIKHKYANCGRQINGLAALLYLLHQRRHSYLPVGGNLEQSIPKFVYQRDASLLFLDHNGAFDDGGLHAVATAATDNFNTIRTASRTTRRMDSVGKGLFIHKGANR